MNFPNRSRYDMLIRVRNFGAAHVQRFPETSSVHAAFSIVATEVAQIEALAVAEHVSSRSARAARKGEARRRLQESLARAANTAWVLSRTIPELSNHTETPGAIADRQLVTFGRGFVTAATPYVAQFAAHGIAIERLSEQIETFEAAVVERGTRRDELAQTRHRINASLTRALEAVDTLDVTVANTLATDPMTLALWKRERRLEQPRARVKAAAAKAAAFESAVAVTAGVKEDVEKAA